MDCDRTIPDAVQNPSESQDLPLPGFCSLTITVALAGFQEQVTTTQMIPGFRMIPEKDLNFPASWGQNWTFQITPKSAEMRQVLFHYAALEGSCASIWGESAGPLHQ